MRTYFWLLPIFFAAGACAAHVQRSAEEPSDAPMLPHPAPPLSTVATNATSTNAAAVLDPPARALPSGQIENAAALRRFFEALATLDDASAQSDVRMIQLGDSHTAADIGTGAARKMLQARFGDGGRGFVPIGRPWKTWAQDGVHGRSSREWQPEHGKMIGGRVVGDGLYGLAGWSLVTSKRNATLDSEIDGPFSKMELSYLVSPNGGSFDVFVDDALVGRVKTKDAKTKSGFTSFDVQDKPHHVQIKTVGDGTVRMFGAALDRTENGLQFDALGINGERAANVLDWNAAHFEEQVRHRDPQLVVLAYGTNESGDATPASEYEQTLAELLGRVARAAPAAACLFLGPTDRAIKSPAGRWETSPKIIEIVATEKRVAQAGGCAFFDQYAAMGGLGSMAAWATESPPRGRGDRVHFTRQGYIDLGNAFATALSQAYDEWRKEKGLPEAPSKPELLTPPSVPTREPATTPLVSYPISF